jgi:hypothetical protein
LRQVEWKAGERKDRKVVCKRVSRGEEKTETLEKLTLCYTHAEVRFWEFERFCRVVEVRRFSRLNFIG